MSLGALVRDRRRELGMTQELVAGQVDISKPYLSNIETGKAPNPPSDGVLRSMERALSFRPGELIRIAHLEKTPADIRQDYEMRGARLQKLRGIIRHMRSGGTDEGDLDVDPTLVDADADAGAVGELSAGGMVPIINKVTAGYPHHFTDLDYPPGVADEYIRCPDVHDPQAFAARVIGDSMEPDYREGDIVVFCPNTEARSGDDCFVRFGNDEGTSFKRVYQDDEETLRLQPLNRTYPAQMYPREQVTGLWPAVFRFHRLRA